MVARSQRRIARATDWFHEHGTHRNEHGIFARFFGYASWGVWLTLLLASHPIGRSTPLRTVCRLWMWQLWRRTVKRPIIVTLPEGSRLLCPPESNIAAAWVAVGLYEYAEMLFVIDLLRSGDLFLDVGANLGIYTVLAARHGGQVVAFEPNGDTCRTLRLNVKLNSADERVTIHPYALADFDGHSRMNVEVQGSSHLINNSAAAGAVITTVEVRQLDTVMQTRTVPGLAFLKVDAEGFDAEVLRGATHFVQARKPVVLVEVGTALAEVRRWLIDGGYQVYFYREQSRELVAVPADFGGEANLIAIHGDNLDVVAERLRTGRRPRIARPRIDWRAPVAQEP